MMPKKITYAESGENYTITDKFKREAQHAARETAHHLHRFGFSEVEWSRGESVYLIETPWGYLAHVHEALGTKNLVADAMYPIVPQSLYDKIAQDTVASAVNDLITSGASPVSVSMHLAFGVPEWLNNEQRASDLIHGWKNSCHISQCVWSGGETHTLKGIIGPETAMLGVSAIGIIMQKRRLIRGNIKHGDTIILLESSGIHTNGLTLAGEIEKNLPTGYRTRLSDGRMYGEALLDPTVIYVPVIEDCLNNGAEIHYAVNITGHGWRKLMRAKEPFVYVIENIPKPQPIFSFIQEHGPIDDEEAWGNLNMGGGFALYVAPNTVDTVIAIALNHGIPAFHAGHIEKRGGEKKVIIQPKGIEYHASSLDIR